MKLEKSTEFTGTVDGFQRLWTPHRMAYIQGENKPHDPADKNACPFCSAPKFPDAEKLIIYRGEEVFVVCNLYPYNSGHVLVCPYRHVADLTELTNSEREELFLVTANAMRVIRKVSKPEGFNLGMNQGSVAGAGISGHLHQHVVPRFYGDANFFPIIAQTKAMPYLLEQTRKTLADAWEELPDATV